MFYLKRSLLIIRDTENVLLWPFWQKFLSLKNNKKIVLIINHKFDILSCKFAPVRTLVEDWSSALHLTTVPHRQCAAVMMYLLVMID